MSNVVTMPGVVPPATGEAVESVVNLLEEMLEMAKNGEILGIAIAGIHSQGGGIWEFTADCDANKLMMVANGLKVMVDASWLQSGHPIEATE